MGIFSPPSGYTTQDHSQASAFAILVIFFFFIVAILLERKCDLLGKKQTHKQVMSVAQMESNSGSPPLCKTQKEIFVQNPNT